MHQLCVLFSSDVRFLLLFSMPSAGTISPAILLWEAVPAACQSGRDDVSRLEPKDMPELCPLFAPFAWTLS